MEGLEVTKTLRSIESLREELNRVIFTEKDFNEIYTISTQLDNLIVQYYKKK